MSMTDEEIITTVVKAQELLRELDGVGIYCVDKHTIQVTPESFKRLASAKDEHRTVNDHFQINSVCKLNESISIVVVL